MARNPNYNPRAPGSSFRASVRKWIKITKKREDFVIQEILIVGLDVAVKETPVDTGRARASWRLGKDRIDYSVDQRPARSEGDFPTASGAGDSELARNFRAAKKAKMGHVWWITNNLPYIIPLEDGYSTKGQAMLVQAFGAVLARLPGIVRRARSKVRN